MADRRQFLKTSLLGASALAMSSRLDATEATGIAANQTAWAILGQDGHAPDAVEAGALQLAKDQRALILSKSSYPA